MIQHQPEPGSGTNADIDEALLNANDFSIDTTSSWHRARIIAFSYYRWTDGGDSRIRDFGWTHLELDANRQNTRDTVHLYEKALLRRDYVCIP